MDRETRPLRTGGAQSGIVIPTAPLPDILEDPKVLAIRRLEHAEEVAIDALYHVRRTLREARIEATGVSPGQVVKDLESGDLFEVVTVFANDRRAMLTGKRQSPSGLFRGQPQVIFTWAIVGRVGSDGMLEKTADTRHTGDTHSPPSPSVSGPT